MNRRLTKSNQNVVLTGTLGGIAEYMGIDPSIIRLIYVVLSIFSACFPGFFLYIILACIIPKNTGRNYQNNQSYRENPYDQARGHYGNPYKTNKKAQRKEAEKINDDDWSDF